MQGAKGDNDESGSVSENGQGPNGNGDSTSFSSDEVPKVDEYVVESGDNLWNIAAKASVYHSGWLYPLIVKANRGKIKDTKNLTVGMLLKIPRGLDSADYEKAREEAMADTYVGQQSDLSGPAEVENFSSLPIGTGKVEVAPPKAKGHGWLWLLWLILALLAGIGVWQYLQMREGGSPSFKKPQED